MKSKISFVGILMLLILVGCTGTAPGYYQAPAGYQIPGGSSVDPFSQGANAQATVYMANAQIQATANAATQWAAMVTQYAEATQMVNTQAAAGATANAASTVQAEIMIQAASTRAAEATSGAVSGEATRAAIFSMATGQALDLESTQIARTFERERIQMSLERERTTNKIRAFFWYVVGVAFIVILIYILYRRAQYFRVKGDLGSPEYVIVGNRLIVPKLVQGPITDIRKLPAASDWGDVIDVGVGSVFEIVEADQARPILDEVNEKLIDEQV